MFDEELLIKINQLRDWSLKIKKEKVLQIEGLLLIYFCAF